MSSDYQASSYETYQQFPAALQQPSTSSEENAHDSQQVLLTRLLNEYARNQQLNSLYNLGTSHPTTSNFTDFSRLLPEVQSQQQQRTLMQAQLAASLGSRQHEQDASRLEFLRLMSQLSRANNAPSQKEMELHPQVDNFLISAMNAQQAQNSFLQGQRQLPQQSLYQPQPSAALFPNQFNFGQPDSMKPLDNTSDPKLASLLELLQQQQQLAQVQSQQQQQQQRQQQQLAAALASQSSTQLAYPQNVNPSLYYQFPNSVDALKMALPNPSSSMFFPSAQPTLPTTTQPFPPSTSEAYPFQSVISTQISPSLAVTTTLSQDKNGGALLSARTFSRLAPSTSSAALPATVAKVEPTVAHTPSSRSVPLGSVDDQANSSSEVEEGSNNNNSSRRFTLYKCTFPSCRQTRRSQSSLQRHAKKHTEEVRTAVCPQCNRKFACTAAMERHARSHTGDKPYLCRWKSCGRRFADISNVKRHELAHLGCKPYVCSQPDCGRAFTRRSTLKAHLISVHNFRSDDPKLIQTLSRKSRTTTDLLRLDEIVSKLDGPSSSSSSASSATPASMVPSAAMPSIAPSAAIILGASSLGLNATNHFFHEGMMNAAGLQ